MANHNLSEVEQIFGPFLQEIGSNPNLTAVGEMRNWGSFYSYFLGMIYPGTYAIPATIYGSRLIPRKNFETDEEVDKLVDVVLKIQELSGNPMLVSMAGGGQVALNADLDMALSKHWRSALWNFMTMYSVSDSSTSEEKEALKTDITRHTDLLRDITPGSGAYLNEADVNEPDWQYSFFGDSYPRLMEIKEKYDPDALFVCAKCVGSERWSDDLNCPRGTE